LLFGRLIKSAVSRQREFLADAAAVQFTRNPDGLVGALKKIGGLGQGSGVTTPRAEEASHLFFGNAMSRQGMSWFATHPPLLERIRVWEPAFDGEYPVTQRVRMPEGGKGGNKPPLISATKLPPILQSAAAAVALGGVLDQAGRPTAEHLEYANGLLGGLPEDLHEAAHEPMSATALIYALMLDRESTRRETQMALIRGLISEPMLNEISRIVTRADSVPLAVRLPLVEICLPALKRLSPDQYAEFDRCIGDLVAADGQIEIHEYALQHMLRRHLEPRFRAVRRPVVQYHVIKPLMPDLVVVLSVLARVGNGSPEAVAAAFAVGMRGLDAAGVDASPMELARANLGELDAALERLTEAAPALNRKILEACARTVSADGQVEVREAELLRAIADSLDCPLPPFLMAS
jgi:hypothetical protein